MSKIKKLPKITGTVNSIFNRTAIYNLAILTNAQSDAINHLVEVVEKLESRIKELEQAGEHHD